MLILKHLKNAPTYFDHYSDHLQGARRFLVKVTEFKNMVRLTFYNLNIFLNSVTLTRNIRAP